jgi:hypothetical protein
MSQDLKPSPTHRKKELAQPSPLLFKKFGPWTGWAGLGRTGLVLAQPIQSPVLHRSVKKGVVQSFFSVPFSEPFFLVLAKSLNFLRF